MSLSTQSSLHPMTMMIASTERRPNYSPVPTRLRRLQGLPFSRVLKAISDLPIPVLRSIIVMRGAVQGDAQKPRTSSCVTLSSQEERKIPVLPPFTTGVPRT